MEGDMPPPARGCPRRGRGSPELQPLIYLFQQDYFTITYVVSGARVPLRTPFSTLNVFP